jgi:hypothetical protein
MQAHEPERSAAVPDLQVPQRYSGVLCHPTSLPGGHGIGDLGDGTAAFIDWLATARQTRWQVLPLGPTGYGDSPYQSFSAFAGNPLLVSLDALVTDGLLEPADLDGAHFPDDHVDFGAVMARMRRLRAALSPIDGVERLTKIGVDVYLGDAAFTSPTTVEVDGRTLEFAKAVITTGARAAALPIPGLEDAGYLACKKSFEGRMPRTEYSLTASGKRAFEKYIGHMEALIKAVGGK